MALKAQFQMNDDGIFIAKFSVIIKGLTKFYLPSSVLAEI